MSFAESATIPERVLDVARRTPDHEAVIGRRTVSWRELAARGQEVAAALTANGIGPGDRVACLLPNDERYYEAFLGIALSSAMIVSLNSLHQPEETAWIVQDCAPKVILTTDELAGRLPSGVGVRVEIIDRLAGDPTLSAGRVLPDADDALAILYTSGTTGRPKGAVFTHGAFVATARNLTDALGLTSVDRHLVVSPLAFTGGLLTGSQAPLYTGGTILVQDGFYPAALLERIGRERPTVFMAVPAMLARLRSEPGYDPAALRSLRYLGCGSAPVPAPLLAAYQADGIPIGHAYGFTEGGGLATVLRPEEMSARPASAGRACPHTEVRISPETEPGTAGEVLQRGPGVMREYWRNPEASAAAVVDGWVRSGDLGVIDPDGYLTLVGRSKDLIISGGMNIYPAEVESVLAAHPSIDDVAVIGVEHPVYGETVVAVVVTGDPQLDIELVRGFCDGRLAAYKTPRLMHVVDELPRTSSGKVRKDRLRAGLSEGQPLA